METIRCHCNKAAKEDLLIGTQLVLYSCETNECEFANHPLCYCKKISNLVTGDNNSYFSCNSNSCNFVILRCKCTKLCSVKISKITSNGNNPGSLYWLCTNQNKACKDNVCINESITTNFSTINYIDFYAICRNT